MPRPDVGSPGTAKTPQNGMIWDVAASGVNVPRCTGTMLTCTQGARRPLEPWSQTSSHQDGVPALCQLSCLVLTKFGGQPPTLYRRYPWTRAVQCSTAPWEKSQPHFPPLPPSFPSHLLLTLLPLSLLHLLPLPSNPPPASVVRVAHRPSFNVTGRQVTTIVETRSYRIGLAYPTRDQVSPTPGP